MKTHCTGETQNMKINSWLTMNAWKASCVEVESAWHIWMTIHRQELLKNIYVKNCTWGVHKNKHHQVEKLNHILLYRKLKYHCSVLITALAKLSLEKIFLSFNQIWHKVSRCICQLILRTVHVKDIFCHNNLGFLTHLLFSAVLVILFLVSCIQLSLYGLLWHNEWIKLNSP